MSTNISNKIVVKPAEDHRFNIIKGIFIIGVVSTHFAGSFVRSDLAWTEPFYLGLLLNQFSSFAVPGFVFLSGWLLELGYGQRPIDYASFYRRRLVKLGIPYLIASLFYIVYFQSDVNAKNILFKLLYFGVQPTLYFVPLIFQLYLFYPLLKTADKGLGSMVNRNKVRILKNAPVLGLMFLFLVLHILIGYLAYNYKINYYLFCIRFSPFWLIYFYAGMHFRTLMVNVRSEKVINGALLVSLSAGIALFGWNIVRLLDRNRVGPSFERNILDLAYCRPEILPYDIAVVLFIGFLLLKVWSFRSLILEIFGKYSYHIYIWHIAVLLIIAWQVPSVLATCTKYPEVILIVILLCCSIITAAGYFLRIKYLIKVLSFVETQIQNLIVKLKPYQAGQE